MKTFTQFLEAIRDKIGDYSGDPLQAMAAKDIAEEDDLPYEEVDEYFIKPIRDIAAEIIKVANSDTERYDIYLRSPIEQLITVLKSNSPNIRSLRQALKEVIRWKNSPEAKSAEMKPLFDKLILTIKNMRHRGVKSSFARYGHDYDVVKMIRILSKRFSRFGAYAYVDRNDPNIDRLFNMGSSSIKQEYEKRDSMNSNMAHTFLWLAAYKCGDGPKSPDWNFFVKIINDPKLLRKLNPNIKHIVDKIKERL